MSTRSVTIHCLSTDDLRAFKEAVKESPKAPHLAALDVLRAGLDAMAAEKVAAADAADEDEGVITFDVEPLVLDEDSDPEEV